jgi:hypothetical protein
MRERRHMALSIHQELGWKHLFSASIWEWDFSAQQNQKEQNIKRCP